MGQEFCAADLPGGFNQDCIKPPAPVKGLGILTKGITFSALSDILNKITWKTKIQQSLTAFYIPVLSYEVTSTAPNNEESTSGQKEITKINPPSATFFVDTGLCNFNEMKKVFDGGDYDVVLFLQDGSMMFYEGEASLFGGFTANITAGGNQLPMPDSKAQSFPIYINYEDRDQFTTSRLAKPIWNPLKTLKTYLPDGYNMTIKTALVIATSTVIVWVRKRCGAVVTGLATADFEVLFSNDLSDVTIAATDNSDGTYDLLIQKEASPVDLVAGDYVGCRVKELTSSVVDALSNKLLVEAE
jgi:hypothetical protein